MTSKVALIFGSTGRLGNLLSSYLQECGYGIKRQVRGELRNSEDIRIDPFSTQEITTALRSIQPDVVLNLIALTDISLCEENQLKAFQVNSLIPYNISKAICSLDYNCTNILFLRIMFTPLVNILLKACQSAKFLCCFKAVR